MKLLAETIIWLIIIQAFVFVHYWIIEKWHKSPWHAVSFIIAAFIAWRITVIAFDTTTFRIVSMIYLGLMYWIVFPLELNHFRGKPILYLSDRGMDRIEASLKKPAATLGLKIVLMLACSFILLDLPNPFVNK